MLRSVEACQLCASACFTLCFLWPACCFAVVRAACRLEQEQQLLPLPLCSGVAPTDWLHERSPCDPLKPFSSLCLKIRCHACSGVVLTNWVDVIKVRQQLAGPEGRNLLATGWRVVRTEGISALGKGVTPAVARGMLYGGACGCCYGGLLAEAACIPPPLLRTPIGRQRLAVAAALCLLTRCPAHSLGSSTALTLTCRCASCSAPAGLRIGLYAPMKRLLGAEAKESSALGSKVAAGMLSGAIAAGAWGSCDRWATAMRVSCLPNSWCVQAAGWVRMEIARPGKRCCEVAGQVHVLHSYSCCFSAAARARPGWALHVHRRQRRTVCPCRHQQPHRPRQDAHAEGRQQQGRPVCGAGADCAGRGRARALGGHHTEHGELAAGQTCRYWLRLIGQLPVAGGRHTQPQCPAVALPAVVSCSARLLIVGAAAHGSALRRGTPALLWWWLNSPC